jgi:cytochrome c biogenesis protein ResB
LLGHVGLVLLVASVLVGSRVAWWERDVVLGPGQEYQGQHDMSLTVRLDDFHEYSSASGGAASYRASVTILENGIEVAEGAVSPGQPMRHRGVFLYQLSHGPLIKVRGVAAEGSAISLQTLGPAGELLKEASLQLSEGDNEGYVAVPDRNLVLRVVFQPGSASDAQGSPSLLLQAYRGGTTDLVFSDSFAQSASVQIEDDSYAVEWGEYAVLGLAHDPSIAPMMLGAIMLLTGTTVAMLVRPRCFWAAVKGKEGVVQASLLNAAEDTKGSGAREFERLMAELEEACRGS